MSINPYSGVVYYYNDSEGEKKKKIPSTEYI